MIPGRVKTLWQSFWLAQAGLDHFPRFATRLATWGVSPYKKRVRLAWVHPSGYIAASAEVSRKDLRLGKHVFIGERVVIYREGDGAPVELGDGVELHHDCIVEALEGGSVNIGSKTTVQAHCNFVSAAASIRIGSGVQIAQLCAFYSFDHGFAPDELIYSQPLKSKGPIIIEDDAWLGFNVVVLSGVRIGHGAVVGASSVVTHDIPPGAIAAGAPARVLKMRQPEQ
jgi:acetyltransferase-like isoleucine patch superfamily enzyme